MFSKFLSKSRVRLFLIIIVSLIIISFIFVILWFNIGYGYRFFGVRIDVISIKNNEDFSYYGFEGEGSKQNPFIIEDLKIGTAKKRLFKSYTLLSIEGISTHLIIRNCTFLGGFNQIHIYQFQGNLTVYNNTFLGAEHYSSSYGEHSRGIVLRYSENITISNNYFDEKLHTSLAIHGSKNIEVFNNDVREFIILTSSTLILFQNNRIQGDIWFEFGFNTSFHCNVFFNSTLYFDYMRFFFMKNNSFLNGLYGLEIRDLVNGTICNNSFTNIEGYAINLSYETTNVSIYYNNFIDNNIDSFSQCRDDWEDNVWYNLETSLGNFWSDLGFSSTYTIAGSADSVDLYPLTSPII